MERKFIEDKQGNKILPITHVDAVRDDSGNTISSIIGALEDEVRNVITPKENYVTVSATSGTTSATQVLPTSGQSTDTIYRVSNWDGSTNSFNVTKYSEYAWDGTQYVFLCVKSQIDEVFDITVYNSNTKYADLAAALGTDGANIPQDLRRGGMSVKYVQSSDNKYVQHRYTVESVDNANFTNEANWELVVTNKNLSEDFLGLLSEIKDFTIKDYAIVASGKFGTSTTYKHAVLSVNEGEVYYLIGQSSTCRAAFVTTDESSSGADVPVVSGTEIMPMSSTQQYYKFIIPQGCTHLIFNASGSYGTRCYKHYDSLKEGTDEYTDNEPIVDSEKLVKSNGVNKFVTEHISFKYGEIVVKNTDIIKKRIHYKLWYDDYYSILIPTIKGKQYIITANDRNSALYCFLKSNDTTVGSIPDFATGYSDEVEIPLSEEINVTAPDDATWLYIYAGNINLHRLPSHIALIDDYNLQKISELNTDLNSKISQETASLRDTMINVAFEEVPKIYSHFYSINSNGTLGQSLNYSHDSILVKEGDILYLQNLGSSNNVRYCFATEEPASTASAIISLVQGTSVVTVTSQSVVKITAPTDCLLLYNSVGYSSILFKERTELANLGNKKILCIGNSWGRDSFRNLWAVANAAGIKDMTIVQAYLGGSSLYNQYKGMDDPTLHYTHEGSEQYVQGTYQEWKYTSATPVKTPSSDYNNGLCGVFDGTAYGKDENGNWAAKTLQEILASEDWDIINIAINNYYLQSVDCLTINNAEKGYFNILDFIARMEQELTPECLAKVKWSISDTWAYPVECAPYYKPKGLILDVYNVENWDTLTNEQKTAIYEQLYPTGQRVFQELAKFMGGKIHYVVSTAKALQLGRNSEWLGDVGFHMVRSRTDTHLAGGIPKYICACNFVYDYFGVMPNKIDLAYIPSEEVDEGTDGGSETNPTAPTRALCIGARKVAWQSYNELPDTINN